MIGTRADRPPGSAVPMDSVSTEPSTTPGIMGTRSSHAAPHAPVAARVSTRVLTSAGARGGRRTRFLGRSSRHAAAVARPYVRWALRSLGTSLALALGGRVMDPVEVEAEAAAGPAV